MEFGVAWSVSGQNSKEKLITKSDTEIENKICDTKRKSFWSEGIAAGEDDFLNTNKADLGIKQASKKLWVQKAAISFKKRSCAFWQAARC